MVFGNGRESNCSFKAEAQTCKKNNEDLGRFNQIFEEDPESFQGISEFYGYEEIKKWQETLKKIK